jgi:DNA mismatch endonuclease, patch repair protein
VRLIDGHWLLSRQEVSKCPASSRPGCDAPFPQFLNRTIGDKKMPDILSKRERSERMRLIRSVHTKPEIAIRKILSLMGFRYRLHSRVLPGRPDIVFCTSARAIFVHGCFWHRHKRCRLARLPKSKLDYWSPKLEANSKRDVKNQRALRKLGWRYLVIWECELGNPRRLENRIRKFLKRCRNNRRRRTRGESGNASAAR